MKQLRSLKWFERKENSVSIARTRPQNQELPNDESDHSLHTHIYYFCIKWSFGNVYLRAVLTTPNPGILHNVSGPGHQQTIRNNLLNGLALLKKWNTPSPGYLRSAINMRSVAMTGEFNNYFRTGIISNTCHACLTNTMPGNPQPSYVQRCLSTLTVDSLIAKASSSLKALRYQNRNIPLLRDLKHRGKYLSEDFDYAGGKTFAINRRKNKRHARALMANSQKSSGLYYGCRVYGDKAYTLLLRSKWNNTRTLAVKDSQWLDSANIKHLSATYPVPNQKAKQCAFENTEEYNLKTNESDFMVVTFNA